MNGIYLTIYLIDHIVFCSVGALQVTYFDSNIFITIWCQSAEGPGVDNLAQSEFFPIRQKKTHWEICRTLYSVFSHLAVVVD